MKLTHAKDFLIRPALELATEISGKMMGSAEAEIMLLTIGQQESEFEQHLQRGGPARSYWQFERAGGVDGVMNHHLTSRWMRALTEELDYQFDDMELHNAMAYDGLLAAAMARFLLWTDPHPLPKFSDPQGTWDLYARVWRPGRPHPDRWPERLRCSIECAGHA